MPLLKQVNPVPKINDDTGFSTTGIINGSRFINKDGTFNLHKKGPFWDRFSIFYTMINLPLWQFICIIVIFFFSINLVYTSIYWLIGADQFTGFISGTPGKIFKELYFFSTETFTTVGYGRVNPVGDMANLVAAVEAMSGFLSFALATGLIYGRFARPRAHVAFSNDAVIIPFKDKTALMFRFVCYKQNHALSDVTVQVNLAMTVSENGEEAKYRYYTLNLERSKIESMPMNWTVVHPIDNESPLAGFTKEDLAANDVEIYVLIRGFNDVYGNTVQQRTSYTYHEILFNRKFIPMYYETPNGTVLELHKLNKHEAVKVPGL
ncbi:transporter [Niastella koreensis]|uniref:Ion transport 2 domain protein n=2 Tax=Niastella koreensis TaxID=354356 RepID=G8TR41_NIAKG|nr:ion channel [Niastella koreensis]AEV98955.1 Ion transport 2 domain protein [Niastella koreensis GR20-10]OQP43878.1 transporter [Niastella koreensis]